MAGQEHILVIKLGALGDFVQSLGPLSAIRRHHPYARITLLTTKPFVSLAQASGYVDAVRVDERPKIFQPLKWLSLRNFFNHGNFARVYDLQNNDRTSFYFKLFSRIPEWVGTAQGASHRNISKTRTQGLAFHGHVETLALAGIKDVALDVLDWVKGRDDFDGLKKPYVLLIPGSAPNRPLKRWPVSHYALLAQKFHAAGYQPVLIGTAAESGVLDAIHAACPAALHLGGQTSLMDIVALARSADFIVGNDTGPMHMAAPTGTPCLVLFSEDSNPVRHAPMGARVTTLQKDSLEDLSVEEVWAEIYSHKAS